MRRRGDSFQDNWRSARGRGGGRGGGAPPWRQKFVPTPRPPSPPLGNLLDEISVDNLYGPSYLDEAYLKITDAEYVASFNWVESGTPSIVVPGLPPVWKPLNEPTQLTADAGEYFRDQNAARYPKHPMEPAVRAVLAQNESLQTRDVDIFACSSTLGNLLRFVRRGEYKPFRFVVEKVGKTVFFIRRENAPDEKLQDVKGYGHTFPEAYTEWKKEVAGSESHQRIISYAFGGQKFLVRSETDGYLEGAVAAEHIKSKSFSIDPSLHNPDALAMQKGGLEIPQGAIFDIKTRTLHKKGQNHLADQIGRLWINQTPNFILAFHDQGKFTDIQVQDIKPEVEKWERDKVEGLAGFAGLINRIVHFVRLLEAGRCEVRCQEQGILELREAGPDTGHALPAALAQRWAGERESSSDEAAGEEVAENEESSDPMWSDDDSEKDYTACSAEDCGYCGHCKY